MMRNWFVLIFEAAPYGMALLDADGNWIEVNPALCQTLDHPARRLREACFTDFIHPDSLESILKALARLASGETRTEAVEARFRRPDRRRAVWLEVSLTVTQDGRSGRPWIVAQFQDIDTRKRQEERIPGADERFRRAFEGAAIGMALLDLQAPRVIEANAALCSMLGREHDALVGSDLLSLADPADMVEAGALIESLGSERTRSSAELRFVTASGRTLWALVSISVLDGPASDGHRYAVIEVVNIAARKEAEIALRQQLLHDPLTGLANRLLLLDRLRHSIDRARRSPGSVALLFLDLDGFKVVNDSLGHHAGDRLLVEVARRLEGAVRPGDTVARLGGDEFVVLAEGLQHRDDAKVLVKRIHHALSSPVRLAGVDVTPEASVGTAIADGQSDPLLLLREADMAMYRAKQHVRHLAPSEGLYPRAEECLRIEKALRLALIEGSLSVVFQPVVDLGTGAVRAVEAFARLDSLGGGHPPTARLLEVAEDAGLSAELDLCVLAAALAQQHRWGDRLGPVPPSSIVVNVAARSLGSESFAADAQRLLAASHVSGRDLCLDFVSADLPKLEARQPELERLRGLGIRFGIDNIGSDFPSLRSLTWLAPDFVKIDTSRVAGDDRSRMKAVSAMVNISRALGLTTVAQAVERRDKAEQLQQLGCDLGQGYHFGSPVPAMGLEALLLRGALPAEAGSETIDLRLPFERQAQELAPKAEAPDQPKRPEM
ncbi:MAG: hypothetical protein QOI86_2789 [Actinomycetota bacterium]|nr:hypothetical protein [Actinomycetota bacterium]